jgi:hypothetical protein
VTTNAADRSTAETKRLCSLLLELHSATTTMIADYSQADSHERDRISKRIRGALAAAHDDVYPLVAPRPANSPAPSWLYQETVAFEALTALTEEVHALIARRGHRHRLEAAMARAGHILSIPIS